MHACVASSSFFRHSNAQTYVSLNLRLMLLVLLMLLTVIDSSVDRMVVVDGVCVCSVVSSCGWIDRMVCVCARLAAAALPTDAVN